MYNKLIPLLALLALTFLVACSDTPANLFQGYIEGEYVQVSSPIGGALDTLLIVRGQQVHKGDPLFSLEHDFELAAVNEAKHGLRRAQDNLANREKGQRPSEIASIQARHRQAKASSTLAKLEYERRVKLIAEQTISQEELDRAKSDYDQKRQAVKEIASELTTARLGARSDEIRAATAEVLQAQAKLDQARWNLDQKTQSTPAYSLVFDTLYRVGEWVAAGQPVVSLLPPTNVEVRFFVPETVVGQLKIGQKIMIRIDGMGASVPAEIYYISPAAEFTPPVIYSSQSRAKLVFMVKGKPIPGEATKLHPGQPVDVVVPSLTP